ncbi:hypothetical protein ASE76_06975 [Xylophilus sp. Leaf220]|nr:hypothetical protein ASE76_06975 [Xylophilus sp. Leaf220]
MTRLPWAAWPSESAISVLTSLAAEADRCVRLRTADATTAKPLPFALAWGPSTAASSARMVAVRAASRACEGTAGRM